jgi:hypothetical protein
VPEESHIGTSNVASGPMLAFGVAVVLALPALALFGVARYKGWL